MTIFLRTSLLVAAIFAANVCYSQSNIPSWLQVTDGAMLVRAVSSGICIVNFSATGEDGAVIDNQGTAFLVDSAGTFVTAKHVAPPGKYSSEKIFIDCPYSGLWKNDKPTPAIRAVRGRVDPSLDIQLLSSTGIFGDAVPLQLERDDPQTGEKLTIIGYYPQDGFPSPFVKSLDLEQRLGPIFRTSGSVLKGISGAPIFNRYGSVVGLYYMRKDLDGANAPLVGEAVGVAAINRLIGNKYPAGRAPLGLYAGKLQEHLVVEKEAAIETCRRSATNLDEQASCSPIVAGSKMQSTSSAHRCTDQYRKYVFPC